MESHRPKVIAHRGASGHALENSLESFRQAVRLGANGVELDLHVAGSGELVVHHDSIIAGAGPIAALDLARSPRPELANGQPVPTLDLVLQELSASLAGRPAGFEIWIELKSLPPESDSALLAVIDSSPLSSSCAVHSFDHRIIGRLGKRRPALRRGILSTSYPLDPVGPLQAVGGSVLWQEWHLIDHALVQAVHRAGGRVFAWTVNEVEPAVRLADLGIDGLCGNWPERLKIG